jgi:hypothetical protein
LAQQRLADGSLKKYKARLVADGNRQKPWSYDLVSSPTARSASVKFAIAAIKGHSTHIFDVKGAYLKADIDQDIYIRLTATATNNTPVIAKFLKALYGLKQAGKYGMI